MIDKDLNTKKGEIDISALGAILTIVLIVLAVVAGLGGCIVRHVYGNKQLIDLRQNYKYAYVTTGTNTVKYAVKGWKDWKDSDAIQIITEDGTAIYTHLNRVLLTDKAL